MKRDAAVDDAAAVEVAAVRLLANREHSRRELEQKLRRRGIAGSPCDQVLDGLEQRGLLSDERFADGYLRQRVRRGYGPLRVRAELAERGVSETLIEQCLQAAEVDWQAQLQGVVAQKFGGDDRIERRELARRGRQLEQRGFPVGMIRAYLDGLRIVD